jgi:hypothetical protein
MKALLLIMLALVPLRAQSHRGEDESAARERYQCIAHAVSKEAAGDQALEAFLLSVAKHESDYSLDVHEGKRRGDGGRSYGLFQHQMPPGGAHDKYIRIPNHPKKWRAKDIVGTDEASTRRAVWTAAWVLRPKIKACHGNAECVFKSYGGLGRGKMKPEVKKRIKARVSTYFKVRRLMKSN